MKHVDLQIAGWRNRLHIATLICLLFMHRTLENASKGIILDLFVGYYTPHSSSSGVTWWRWKFYKHLFRLLCFSVITKFVLINSLKMLRKMRFCVTTAHQYHQLTSRGCNIAAYATTLFTFVTYFVYFFLQIPQTTHKYWVHLSFFIDSDFTALIS